MISIIVAIAKNGVIGINNTLPWHYKEDLKYFKETTLNKTVVMGRNTFESIISRNNKVLPNRNNVILTSNKNYYFEGATFINDLDDFLSNNKDEEIFIIGGKKLYELTLDKADKLYITHINKEYEGDTYFPEVNFNLFDLVKKEDLGELSFCVYQRKV